MSELSSIQEDLIAARERLFAIDRAIAQRPDFGSPRLYGALSSSSGGGSGARILGRGVGCGCRCLPLPSVLGRRWSAESSSGQPGYRYIPNVGHDGLCINSESCDAGCGRSASEGGGRRHVIRAWVRVRWMPLAWR